MTQYKQYIVIDNGSADADVYPADTVEQIEEAERALAEAGQSEASVWVGEDADAIKLHLKVFASR